MILQRKDVSRTNQLNIRGFLDQVLLMQDQDEEILIQILQQPRESIVSVEDLDHYSSN